MITQGSAIARVPGNVHEPGRAVAADPKQQVAQFVRKHVAQNHPVHRLALRTSFDAVRADVGDHSELFAGTRAGPRRLSRREEVSHLVTAADLQAFQEIVEREAKGGKLDWEVSRRRA